MPTQRQSKRPDFRALPSVDRVLSRPEMALLLGSYAREVVTDLVRECLEEAREMVRRGSAAPTTEAVVQEVRARALQRWRAAPRRVINATGVIIHTNLGRAPLSEEALEAIRVAAIGYSDLEFDLDSGERGSRHSHVERLLCQLTGAEAGLAVNNNASAVLLGLTALASGRQVVVSRGEAVEIGGGFRIPDVLRQSGATLVEVGTTNRTYLRDYARAVVPETAALLKVHTSNFRIVGFTHAPELADLVKLGAERGVPVLHDLGSGCLLDTTAYGLAAEPRPQESLAAGSDLLFFSGDKLLGGPQAGVIVGKKGYVERLQEHPLARAVRIDKLTLAALVATLLHYIRGEAPAKVPVWRMIAADPASLERRAAWWAARLGEIATVVDGQSTVGGGSLPGEMLPTRLLAIADPSRRFGGVQALAERLRCHDPPVIARIEEDQLLLDPRTVLPGEDEVVVQALDAVLQKSGGS